MCIKSKDLVFVLFCPKYPIFVIFGCKAICHMWWVANGLNNAVVIESSVFSCQTLTRKGTQQDQHFLSLVVVATLNLRMCLLHCILFPRKWFNWFPKSNIYQILRNGEPNVNGVSKGDFLASLIDRFFFIRSTVLKLFSITPKTLSCSRTKQRRRSVVGILETRRENNFCRSGTTGSSGTSSTRQPSRPSSPVRMTSEPDSGSSDAVKSSK